LSVTGSVSFMASYAVLTDGCTRQTARLITSTTDENKSLLWYCFTACLPKTASSAFGLSAYSNTARVITVTGLFSAKRSRNDSNNMVVPSARCAAATPARGSSADVSADGPLHRGARLSCASAAAQEVGWVTL